MKRKYELMAHVSGCVLNWGAFACFEMLSNGIVKQGSLAFILSLVVAISAGIALIFFADKDNDQSAGDKEKERRPWPPRSSWPFTL